MSTLVGKVMERHLPEHWTPMPPETEVLMVDVDEGTEEYDNVCSKFLDEDVPKVRKLQRIQNPYLWAYYQLKKREFEYDELDANEVTLYHETSEDNLKSIIADNFDWRRYERTMFGKGISFSASPEYAKKRSTYKGVMFVARVLRGQCFQGKECLVPPEGYDTTTSGLFNSLVIVAYNDSDFYPEYVVFWEPTDEKDGETSDSLAFPG